MDTWDEALHAAKLAEAARPVKEVPVSPVSVRGKMTVAGYMPVFLDGHKLRATSRETYAKQSKHVLAHIGMIPLAELKPADVRSFARKLEASDLAASTVGKIMCILRGMCRMAVVDGLMDTDPTTTIKAGGSSRTEMRILTRDEYATLLGEISPHYRLLVETLIQTGVRWGEVLGIKHDAVTKTGKVWILKIRRTVAEIGAKPVPRDFGKTPSATRTITITEALAKRILAVKTGPDGYVFRTVRGAFITRSLFFREFGGAKKRAGIDGLRVHDLRHTAISWWVNAGIPLHEVRDRAGHTDLSTTSRYIHVVAGGDDPFTRFNDTLAA
jgi:integrase